MRTALNGLVTMGVLLCMHSVGAAPKADLWERWKAHDETATERLDHASWTKFLKRYLVSDREGLNRLGYGRVAAADRRNLEQYLEYLQAVSVSELNRNEQFAYWVNLYNALTVHVVLDHYPVESILDISISPGLFSKGPWKKELISVEGEDISLDDIEHRILRPIWRDPRVHYAVNCASVGCPNLASAAFTASNADALLDKGARGYINSPRGVAVDSKGRLNVSSIYEWFKEDFGDSDQGVIEHIRQYANAELASALRATQNIAGDFYDWSLNDVKAEKETHERIRGGSGGSER